MAIKLPVWNNPYIGLPTLVAATLEAKGAEGEAVLRASQKAALFTFTFTFTNWPCHAIIYFNYLIVNSDKKLHASENVS